MKTVINPVTNEYETVPDDWVIHYIPQTGEYKYGPPNSGIEYGTVNREFLPREEGAYSVYNPPEGVFEVGTGTYNPVFNTVKDRFEMKPEQQKLTNDIEF